MAYAPSFYVGLNGNWLTLKSDAGNLEHVQGVYLAFPLNATDDKIAALNKAKWSALKNIQVGIAGAGVAPSLKNLANNASVLGNAIDPTAAADRQRYVGLELLWRAVNGSLTGAVEVYFIPSIDGTTYADGDASVVPNVDHRVAIMTPRAGITTQQRLAALWSLQGTSQVTGRPILMPPFKFKPLVRNLTGQAATNTDNENVLNLRMYDLEHVSPA